MTLRLCLSGAVVWCVATAATPSIGSAQVTRRADLAFGTIVAGTTSSVAPTSPNAASWQLAGVSGVGTGFTLTLPTSLARVGGGATLPITFCTTCGIYRLNNTNPAGGTTFNPHDPVSLPLLASVTTIYVWLGGSLAPLSTQTPGAYTATVVLTVTGITL